MQTIDLATARRDAITALRRNADSGHSYPRETIIELAQTLGALVRVTADLEQRIRLTEERQAEQDRWHDPVPNSVGTVYLLWDDRTMYTPQLMDVYGTREAAEQAAREQSYSLAFVEEQAVLR